MHSYPHSWRSKAPLIFRNTPQWFISMKSTGLRKTALDAIAATTWVPAGGRNRIQAMIEQLQSGVRNAVQAMSEAQLRARSGSQCVEKAAQSLAVIADEVGTINEMNTQIATAAEQQSAVAEEINRNITTISRIADTTSADASQTSQISDELVRLATELNRLVGQFKL